MAKCIAESLLSTYPEFDGLDCRMRYILKNQNYIRYILWLENGYCNGTLNKRSFGLGGNIS